MCLGIVLSLTLLILEAHCIVFPETCKDSQYYDPDKLTCEYCMVNASLIPSEDGFGCVCDRQSVSEDISKCRKCNSTEIPTRDKTACVPRRCQKDKAGRLACRRCPTGYVSVLQNFDGSPMREVQCMKCARGYKAVGERCERCVHCTCQRNETLVKDVCMSKEFINNRPKPESGRFHPNAVVEIVRNEYMCLKGDVRACRNLTDKCVKSLYSSDQGGPCRLWIQNKPPPGLVQLAFDPMKSGQSGFSEQISLAKGQKHVLLVLTVHTPGGGIKFLRNIDNKSKCLLPMAVHVGNYYTSECSIPIDYLLKFSGESLAAYADMDGSLRPLPITIRTPSGRSVQKGNWATNQFNRYYLIDRFLNPSNNLSSIIYLRTLIVHVRIKRDVANDGLRIKISLEAHYASHSDREKTVTTSLRIENDLPQAGILRALEIWGSVLSAVAVLYAALVWRGTARRGGSQLAIGPLLAGYLADGLLVAAWCTTLHALAAEATNTGFPLPLSKTEETTIEAFVYSAISLKIIYVLWFNWCQSRIDVFLLDWSEYNTTARDVEVFEAKGQGGAVWILREFAALQATRRASPAYTVPLTLLILRLSLDVQDSLPDSPAYFWAFCVSVWLCAHLSILTLNWMKDKALGVPVLKLLTACRESGTSLIAFKEEFYAHYIHGRNDVISDTRSFTGPLATGRVLCVPQIRSIYTQLSTPIPGDLNDNGARRALLSKFLAAFFERALDGLTWIAVERTLLERLFDVELSSRESGNTSTILYDPETSTPSILNLTCYKLLCGRCRHAGDTRSLTVPDPQCIRLRMQDFQSELKRYRGTVRFEND